MLVSAEVELIFFMEVGMGLCFGYVLSTGLIISGCCYCEAGLTQNQDLFCFLYCHTSKEVGGVWEEIQLGQVSQTDQRAIPDHPSRPKLKHVSRVLLIATKTAALCCRVFSFLSSTE